MDRATSKTLKLNPGNSNADKGVRYAVFTTHNKLTELANSKKRIIYRWRDSEPNRMIVELRVFFRRGKQVLGHYHSHCGTVLSKAMISIPIPLMASIIYLVVVTFWHAITSLRPGRARRNTKSLPMALCARAVDKSCSTS
jgi:hypothetical protein